MNIFPNNNGLCLSTSRLIILVTMRIACHSQLKHLVVFIISWAKYLLQLKSVLKTTQTGSKWIRTGFQLWINLFGERKPCTCRSGYMLEQWINDSQVRLATWKKRLPHPTLSRAVTAALLHSAWLMISCGAQLEGLVSIMKKAVTSPLCWCLYSTDNTEK